MNSGLIFFSKIKADSLLKVQTFNNNQFFINGPLFGVLYKEKNPGDFSLAKMAEQKRGVSGLISRFAWGEYFLKAL